MGKCGTSGGERGGFTLKKCFEFFNIRDRCGDAWIFFLVVADSDEQGLLRSRAATDNGGHSREGECRRAAGVGREMVVRSVVRRPSYIC
jgi:hypothetical protein